MKSKKIATALTVLMTLSNLHASAQEVEVDATTGATQQVSKTEKVTNALSRLHIGGYGEAVSRVYFHVTVYLCIALGVSHYDRYGVVLLYYF